MSEAGVDREQPAVYLVTGVMAAGKSTVAELLAGRFERGVHVRGDVFRKMIVSGRAPITPELTPEDLRQLSLRRELAASVATTYWKAGFSVALQDIYIGAQLVEMVDALDVSPLHVVVLVPRPDVVAERERSRPKTGYRDWEVAALCAALEAETPRIGLWLDTSELSAGETVERILAGRAVALVK